MSYSDLRQWLEVVASHGELKRISGADWDMEMSNICEIIHREGKDPKPALLFDDVPGYPKGYRTLFALLASSWRVAKSLGLPEDQTDPLSLVRNWRSKLRNIRLIPPEFVSSGPVQANIDTGDKIDLLKFPVPRFHELDGGRYIGTAHAVIQREPDDGWVNLGTYRIMLVDRNRLTLHIVEAGGHGGIIMHEKYFKRGKVMPVAIAIGLDPTLWMFSFSHMPAWGVSEYNYAGAIKGKPVEVIEGQHTGLPLPANAEIVIEGECHPGELVEEGPFGEWHGYYANRRLLQVPEPVIRVKAVYYRDDPILTGAHMAVPPHDTTLPMAVFHSAGIWDRLEAFGIPGIKGVWCHELGSGQLFNVISIEQLYAGHARDVGIIASHHPKLSRYTIVVEEDIDPSNLEQVLWALVTRVLPDESIQILRGERSGSHDPAIRLEEKEKYRVAPEPLTSSRAIIDACRSLTWKADWYPIARTSPELKARLLKKWQAVLSDVIKR